MTLRRDRRRAALPLLGIAGAALLARAAMAGPPPGYLSRTLPNGLQVSILPDPAHPVVATEVWVHLGSANEDPSTRGFAHLFEHLMFSGTPRHPERSYWEVHERHGGYNNAYTSFDETVYISEIPPAGQAQALELEADRLVHLNLDEEKLEDEKRIVTEELRMALENSPIARLFSTALEKLLDDHPYALTPAGTKEDIERATLDQARDFYERYYRPRNVHVVVVGPVDAGETLAAIERDFGGLPAEGESPPEVPALLDWTFPEEIDLVEDLPPVEISVLGFPLPPPAQADAWAVEVAMTALADGQWDPLEQHLVDDRGKALFAGCEWFLARRGGGLAMYSVNLPYRRRATAFRHLEESRAELGRFEWLDEARLGAAKRSLIKEALEREYWAESRAAAVGRAAWWQGDERLAFEAADRIEAVTLDEAREAFERYVLNARPIRLHARAEHVPLWVRAFGWLYPLFR